MHKSTNLTNSTGNMTTSHQQGSPSLVAIRHNNLGITAIDPAAKLGHGLGVCVNKTWNNCTTYISNLFDPPNPEEQRAKKARHCQTKAQVESVYTRIESHVVNAVDNQRARGQYIKKISNFESLTILVTIL